MNGRFPRHITDAALEAFRDCTHVACQEPNPVYEQLVSDNACVRHRGVMVPYPPYRFEYGYSLRSRTTPTTPIRIRPL
jgi:hypothetical protein